jgi:predicted enzyme related to lactoylglutathione lyase
MSRPIHFEIHAADPARAIGFYEMLFGWTFTKWDGPMPYWVVKTGEEGTPGIDGGLMPRQGPPPPKDCPVAAYVCTMDVENLDRSVAKAGELGAASALPKMAIPGIGWLAYMKDTEGNIFGMMQNDPAAK